MKTKLQKTLEARARKLLYDLPQLERNVGTNFRLASDPGSYWSSKLRDDEAQLKAMRAEFEHVETTLVKNGWSSYRSKMVEAIRKALA